MVVRDYGWLLSQDRSICTAVPSWLLQSGTGLFDVCRAMLNMFRGPADSSMRNLSRRESAGVTVGMIKPRARLKITQMSSRVSLDSIEAG